MDQPIRNKGEALLDLDYEIRFQRLQERLLKRTRALCGFTSLIAGSVAVVKGIDVVPHGVFIAGVVVAIASAADLVFGYSERAGKHAALRRALCELRAESAGLSMEQIDARLARIIDGDVDDEIEGLRVVAFNDNLRSNGYADRVIRESPWNRIFRLLA